MKKKSLTKQLQEALVEAEYQKRQRLEYHDRALKAEDELEKERRDQITGLGRSLDAANDQNRQLIEIVRWLVNPETAKDPWNYLARAKVDPRPPHERYPY